MRNHSVTNATEQQKKETERQKTTQHFFRTSKASAHCTVLSIWFCLQNVLPQCTDSVTQSARSKNKNKNYTEVKLKWNWRTIQHECHTKLHSQCSCVGTWKRLPEFSPHFNPKLYEICDFLGQIPRNQEGANEIWSLSWKWRGWNSGRSHQLRPAAAVLCFIRRWSISRAAWAQWACEQVRTPCGKNCPSSHPHHSRGRS